ncbi:MAG: hypothetical protein ACYDCL_14230 [Myxococcales bacterium]
MSAPPWPPRWKDRPPSAPDEADAATLLEGLRSPEPLSPAAAARLERHVRELGSRRGSAFALPRLSWAAGSLLALLCLGGIALYGGEQIRGLLGASTDVLCGSTVSPDSRMRTKSLRDFGAEQVTLPPRHTAAQQEADDPDALLLLAGFAAVCLAAIVYLKKRKRR